MGKTAIKDQNYMFSTSVDPSSNQDEFLIELFSYSEDEHDDKHSASEPKRVIHNFDELISFFGDFDQDKIRELYKDPLTGTK
ncbi:hypothetical protein JMM81_15640 [Bacillus sp. V3B]|uniref:hypothetical protein n=1 Tax=Bacillus sp. V3B TaxID=2804915 RepID=UPI00210CC551|nr:hypothetical protein [Bacillus sp. V3B]MCQ6276349.1 hypothetical protein [Bacillus sp. V3B]